MEVNLATTTTQPTGIAPQLRIEELVKTFIQAQDVKESSRDTYKRTLRRFLSWVDKKSYLLSEIARAELLQYKEELLSSGMSSLTVGSYITSVRRFYEWAEANRFYPNVAKGIRTPKRLQQFRKQPLLPSQATALLHYYQDKALRDFAIVNLLLRTGLRTVEVIRANVGDIVFKGSQRVLLVQGKGRDERDNFVVLTDKTYQPIVEYLATRDRVNSSQPLFTSTSNNSKGERLTTRSISYIAKEGLKAIGLNERSFTAHSLRHTTAVNILRAGGSLETAQLTLRHSNPATTQIYTATINEERRLQNSGEALIDSLY
jgi:integrase/recombinase XerD